MKKKSDSSKCSVESEDSDSGLRVVEDFYKARKPRKTKIAPALRSDRIGLKVAPCIRAEHHNTADVHFVQSGQTTTTNTPVKSIEKGLDIKNLLKEIFGKLTPILFPILNYLPVDSHARLSQSLESVKDSRTQGELFSLKSAEYLKLRNPDGFYLRTLKGFLAMIKDAHSKSSYPRWMNWGLMCNGKCLTLRLSYPKTAKGSLSSVLEEKVDEKFYLSDRYIKKMLEYNKRQEENERGFRFEPKIELMNALKVGGEGKDNIIKTHKIRRLTPKECERLQGFPDDWTKECSDTQRYKMMGNAVSVPVIAALGRAILKRVNISPGVKGE